MYIPIQIILLSVLCQNTLQNDIRGFDDTIMFNIAWPGEILPTDDELGGESMIITSSHQEKYQCILPKVEEKETKKDATYEGPTALEYISPLFSQSSCYFRLESYWTYEICHGRYIRQYHEDREGKKVKIQEYILGKWDANYYEKILAKVKEQEADNNVKLPMKKIENVNLPYLEITMENGTTCDLNNNEPRSTKVLYVCYVHGKHEIYSLKEISTCVYEVVILSPLLCRHPKYKPKETGEFKINCLPLDGSSKKPYNLVKLQQESIQMRRTSDLDRLRMELVKYGDEEPILGVLDKSPIDQKTPLDATPVENFLKGITCLYGGTGWWKYEFCYGKYIEQFHVEKSTRKTTINLGVFDKEKHIKWIKDHPHKRPKPIGQRTQLSHFYSGGYVCDKTGQPRQTEVKLKCPDNPASSSSVSLYLLEPKYCEYILGVESPLICQILDKVDENGLVEIAETESSSKTDDQSGESAEIENEPTVKIRL